MTKSPFRISRGFKKRGGGMPMHSHEDAQMTLAASGMVQVQTDRGRWLVPPQLAVWIPAGVTHRVEVLMDAELWMFIGNRRWHNKGTSDAARSHFCITSHATASIVCTVRVLFESGWTTTE